VGQQIAQIRQIILSGANAIVVNAASPTGLDSVLEEAVNRGMVVIAFCSGGSVVSNETASGYSRR
jgi:ribose transport system substrate-binding protein